jgi:hypothetical protein
MIDLIDELSAKLYRPCSVCDYALVVFVFIGMPVMALRGI